MPTLDMTHGDWILLGIAVALVVLPSRLSDLGNLLGRLLKGKPTAS